MSNEIDVGNAGERVSLRLVNKVLERVSCLSQKNQRIEKRVWQTNVATIN
jgi:hypothetical protein